LIGGIGQQLAPFDPGHFDKYVGYYQLSPSTVFKITRAGGRFFEQLTGQSPAEIFPESETKFFLTVAPAQISFDIDARCAVTGLVVHQNGAVLPAKRIDAATAANVASALAARLASQKPSPGTEDALRRYLTAWRTASRTTPTWDRGWPPPPRRSGRKWRRWPRRSAR
jgi:Domain of unknown function (DUF3471)